MQRSGRQRRVKRESLYHKHPIHYLMLLMALIDFELAEGRCLIVYTKIVYPVVIKMDVKSNRGGQWMAIIKKA